MKSDEQLIHTWIDLTFDLEFGSESLSVLFLIVLGFLGGFFVNLHEY